MDQLRIVQYDSCRGLEGWSVFNLGFDDFIEYKSKLWDKNPIQNNDGMIEYSKLKQQYLLQWLMIPLTRGIDTLVIHFSNKESEIKSRVKKIYESNGQDYMEWHNE